MKKKKFKKHQQPWEIGTEQDEHFYYIAGYTSNDAPFGITWEEAYTEGLIENEDDEE